MLETGRVDTISTRSPSPTSARPKYDFSQPYVYDGAQIVVRKGNSTIHGLKDLEGKTVAVNLGSNFEELLRKNGRTRRSTSVPMTPASSRTSPWSSMPS